MSYLSPNKKYKGMPIYVTKDYEGPSYTAIFEDTGNLTKKVYELEGRGRTKDEAIEDLIYWYENEDRRA